jgi:hypothetical protein
LIKFIQQHEEQAVESVLSFADVLEAAEQLSLEEQESLLELLQRRLIERRRAV